MSELHIKDETRQPKTPLEYARLFFTGMAMGAADTVPGVSGGTMAFILGVYGDLLHAIKSFNLDAIRLALRFKIKELFGVIPWRFLVVLFAGIATSVLTLVRFIEPVVDQKLEPQFTFLFATFMGLVLGSAVAIMPKVKRWSPVSIIMLIIGAVAAFLIAISTPSQGSSSPIALFFSGMAAIIAMILPGISGSSILLVLGQYDVALGAVKNLEIVNMAALGLGCVVGLVIFSRILSWLLKTYEYPTIATLIGFVLGSLWAVWPWKEAVREGEEIVNTYNVAPNVASSDFFIAVLLIIFGFLLVNFIDHLASGGNLVFKRIWRREQPDTPMVEEAQNV
jgi:putative membrane protein